MRAVDTNVLVRLITRDDPAQTVAAEDFIETGAWVSVLALAEATRVLKTTMYQRSPAEVATAVEMLLQNGDLVVEHSDIVGAALDLFRERPKLGFPDCLILELARSAGHLPLGTFDRGLSLVEGAQRL